MNVFDFLSSAGGAALLAGLVTGGFTLFGARQAISQEVKRAEIEAAAQREQRAYEAGQATQEAVQALLTAADRLFITRWNSNTIQERERVVVAVTEAAVRVEMLASEELAKAACELREVALTPYTQRTQDPDEWRARWSAVRTRFAELAREG